MEKLETFTLRIELGNDAMRTPEDVAKVLLHTAKYMRENESWPRTKIYDTNGNAVGIIIVI